MSVPTEAQLYAAADVRVKEARIKALEEAARVCEGLAAQAEPFADYDAAGDIPAWIGRASKKMAKDIRALAAGKEQP